MLQNKHILPAQIYKRLTECIFFQAGLYLHRSLMFDIQKSFRSLEMAPI